MNYQEERKHSFFANKNIDLAKLSIDRNMTLRKNELKEKIFLKRLNYSNNLRSNSFFEIDPALLEISEEEKNFQLNDLNEESVNIVMDLFQSQNPEYNKLGVFSLRKFTSKSEENNKEYSIDGRIVKALVQLCMMSDNKFILFEIYWIFINFSIKSVDQIRNEIKNVEFFKAVNKHFGYEIEDMCDEILWFLVNTFDEAPLPLFKTLLNTKLVNSILDNLFRESLDFRILHKSLLFIKYFIISAKKITLTDFMYNRIIEIVCGYLYFKNDSSFKICLEILTELAGYGSFLITNQILKIGIIPRLLKLDKFITDFEIDPDAVATVDYLKEYPRTILILILKFLGNILADEQDLPDHAQELENMGLLEFISNYYILVPEFAEIRKLIVWICSNFITSEKNLCMSLIKTQLFSTIIDSISKEKRTKVIEEILYLIMNILAFRDYEISFSFVNYNLIENLINLYNANAENWKPFMHLFILSVFKSIFQTENLYRLKKDKDYNFDDNNLNFIEYFLRQGYLDFLSNLRIKQDEKVNEIIDEIENEIKKRF